MDDSAAHWLVMVAQLPTEDPASRMRVLRTLESLGAAVIREGAYILPSTPANRQALDSLADYIGKTAGAAHVLDVTAASAAQHKFFTDLFDRSKRYDELIKTVESLRLGYGQADPSAISRVLHKQRREFEGIAALDFFPAAVRGATRKPLWADRLACAWLIRRFVDPEAKMAWLDKGEAAPQNAIGFGFDGAHFTNSGTNVTYEEMLARLDLAKNTALGRIGSIVHFLEVQGTPVPEALGVQTLLQGAVRRSVGENELLAEAEKTFDLLYEAYFEPPTR